MSRQGWPAKSAARFPARRLPHSAFAGSVSEVIVVTVRWYLRCGLSYRDVEELLAEWGIDVDHAQQARGSCTNAHDGRVELESGDVAYVATTGRKDEMIITGWSRSAVIRPRPRVEG
jgi:hypothetical protein